MSGARLQRLAWGDRERARKLFVMMAEVFGEECGPLGDFYLDRLLSRNDFWAIAAFMGDDVVGGMTAHTLPMTRSESSEILIYDIAVRLDHQRKGIGRQLIQWLQEVAGKSEIQNVWVPADNEDAHALDFYRALGGTPTPVTIFTFSPDEG